MNLIIKSISILSIILFISCSDDNNVNPDDNSHKNYLPLDTGNYWVYESSETSTPDPADVFDSIPGSIFNNGKEYYFYNQYRVTYLGNNKITAISASMLRADSNKIYELIQFGSDDFSTFLIFDFSSSAGSSWDQFFF